MGPHGGLHAVPLLGEYVEGAGVHAAVDEHGLALGPPHERDQELEGVVDLPVKEHLLMGVSWVSM